MRLCNRGFGDRSQFHPRNRVRDNCLRILVSQYGIYVLNLIYYFYIFLVGSDKEREKL